VDAAQRTRRAARLNLGTRSREAPRSSHYREPCVTLSPTADSQPGGREAASGAGSHPYATARHERDRPQNAVASRCACTDAIRSGRASGLRSSSSARSLQGRTRRPGRVGHVADSGAAPPAHSLGSPTVTARALRTGTPVRAAACSSPMIGRHERELRPFRAMVRERGGSARIPPQPVHGPRFGG
jgi:hypothetical protein